MTNTEQNIATTVYYLENHQPPRGAHEVRVRVGKETLPVWIRTDIRNGNTGRVKVYWIEGVKVGNAALLRAALLTLALYGISKHYNRPELDRTQHDRISAAIMARRG